MDGLKTRSGSVPALLGLSKFYLFFSSFRSKRLPLHCFSDPLYIHEWIVEIERERERGLTMAGASPRRPPDLADLRW